MKSVYLEEYDCFVRYFVIDGKDPARVYLPGLATPAMSLLSLATHPKITGNKSFLIDFLGSGMSDIPESFDYSISKQAECVSKILEEEGVSGCQFIAHSMGGTVAINVAFNRPDLVSQLIIAESNIESGGGAGSRRIASNSEEDFVKTQFPKWVNDLRDRAVQGDEGASNFYDSLKQTAAVCMYRSAVSLVELPDYFKSKFLNLDIPRTFIYGEKNLPSITGVVMPDIPDIEEMKGNGIKVGIVPNSGHVMFVDNLDGFAEVVAKSLNKL